MSELENASLRAHLGRCVACAAFARELGGLTRELRAAQLERLTVQLMLPRRRAATRALQLSAAAAAVVLAAAALGSLAGSVSSRHAATATVASSSLGPLLDRGRDRGGVAAIESTQQLPFFLTGPSVAF